MSLKSGCCSRTTGWQTVIRFRESTLRFGRLYVLSNTSSTILRLATSAQSLNPRPTLLSQSSENTTSHDYSVRPQLATGLADVSQMSLRAGRPHSATYSSPAGLGGSGRRVLSQDTSGAAGPVAASLSALSPAGRNFAAGRGRVTGGRFTGAARRVYRQCAEERPGPRRCPNGSEA